MLDFRSVTVNFPTLAGGPQRQTSFAVFGTAVRVANTAIKGFDIFYGNGDHHVLRQQVDIDVLSINNNVVNFAVDLVLRDSSGNFDDPFGGSVEVLVIADVA
ncbi:MAG: hypothetical protein ACRD0K_00520 [Egibacteraceae bacterium]